MSTVLINPDLVSLILEYINPDDLIRNVSLVNRLFHILTSSSSVLWEKLIKNSTYGYLLLHNRRNDLTKQQQVYRQYQIATKFNGEDIRKVGINCNKGIKYSDSLFMLGGAFDSICNDATQIDINDTEEEVEVFVIESDEDSYQLKYGCQATTMSLEGETILFGGWEDDTGIMKQILVIDTRNLNDLIVFNEKNTFISDDTPELCYQAAATLSSGNIIISGGCDSPYKNAFVSKDIYSCVRSSCYSDNYLYRDGISYNFDFKLIGQLNRKRCGHSCISTYDDQIIIAGGYGGGNDYLSCIERLEMDNGILRSILLPAMSTPRSGFSMVTASNSSMYIGGGSSNGEIHLNILERLDIRESKIEKLPSSKYEHGYSAGCIGPNERFYLSSGMWNSSKNHGFCPFIELFDIRANKWDILTIDKPSGVLTSRASHSLLYL